MCSFVWSREPLIMFLLKCCYLNYNYISVFLCLVSLITLVGIIDDAIILLYIGTVKYIKQQGIEQQVFKVFYVESAAFFPAKFYHT